MILTTTSRTALRPCLAALAVLPVLALATACGDAGGVRESDAVATAPENASASSSPPASGSTSADAAPPAGKSAFYDAQLKYVRCMRVKGGYTDYPDPKLSGHLDWDKIEAIASRPGQQEAYKGGKNGVCVPELRGVMAVEPRRDRQKDYESMLAHATCMRDNGVSRFINPTMSDGNVQPGGDPNPASPVVDQNSPTYKKAREACRTKLLDGLDGMQ
ncbi:hypothetical protein [Streptomyces sp. bgisy082]|uniref:hypothetical protein n=1 Tax=Streptomyces sp. bgisy082 TaxID=3413776 RepID=UPI003D70A7F2